MTEVIRQVRQIVGVEQLLLGVMTTQIAARKLYESLGFVVFGREARAIRIGDNYYDEEFMVLNLREEIC